MLFMAASPQGPCPCGPCVLLAGSQLQITACDSLYIVSNWSGVVETERHEVKSRQGRGEVGVEGQERECGEGRGAGEGRNCMRK